MGELVLDAAMNGMVSRNRIDAEDVLALRQSIYRDGVVNVQEAEKIITLDHTCNQKCEEWADFYIESLTDYLVNHESPKGYVSEANAEWLVTVISNDNVVDTRTELELLLQIMNAATSVPDTLAAFALRQVANAVLHGKGALARGREAKAGVVTATDVDMLRKVLYSMSGDSGLSISRQEAEVLFDINDATAKADNDPAWTDLFSKAIASSLMVAAGYVAPDRAEALRREAWLNDTSADVGGFFSNVFAGGLRAMVGKITGDFSTEAAHAERNEAVGELHKLAAKIDNDEAFWLAERINRDGEIHENEKELLRFIRREADHIHPALEPLMARVAN